MTKKSIFDTASALFEQCLGLMKAKNHDYAGKDQDDMTNFRRTAEIAHVTMSQGILVRMGDKINRIGNLLEHPAEVKTESIIDTILDLINYSAILYRAIQIESEADMIISTGGTNNLYVKTICLSCKQNGKCVIVPHPNCSGYEPYTTTASVLQEPAKPTSVTAVICLDTDDFIEFKRGIGHINTKKDAVDRFFKNDTMYKRVSSIADICSWAFNCFVEAPLATKNKDYEKILQAVETAIKPFSQKPIETLKNSEEWSKQFKYDIKDPDGWDRTNFMHSWYHELITFEEFERRAMVSTIVQKTLKSK